MGREKQSTHLEWRNDMTFGATTTTGHYLVLDTLPPNGADRGPKPIELVLTALAGCTAMDVLSILKKMREPVVGLAVDVQGTRAESHPMIYTDIELVYHVRGDVAPASVERAIELSEKKYCGVHAMLKHSAHITCRFDIEPAQVQEARAVYAPDHRIEAEHAAVALP